jgi:hypothetical protein
MHILSFTEDWVDLIRLQLKASKNTDDPNRSGYACLCVGKKFDPVIEEYYSEIDEITGPNLHIFSLFPPPPKLYEDRIQRLKKSTIKDCKKREVLKKLNERKQIAEGMEKRTIIHEKVLLLKELGLPPDQYIDFIFFQFSDINSESIKVIYTISAPLKERESNYAYIDLFKKMGEKANIHFSQKNCLETYVKDLDWDFFQMGLLKKGIGLFSFIANLKDIFS